METKLYKKGKTIYEIANIVGISPTGVWKRLKKNGVDMGGGGPRKGTHWSVKRRGKEYLGSDGYVYVRGFDTKVKKCWLVVENEPGRKREIRKGYCVHHKNGIKTDDSRNNLEVRKSGIHSCIHQKGIKNPKKNGWKNRIPKLDKDKRIQINSLYFQRGLSQQKIADIFGIHQTMVSFILRNY